MARRREWSEGLDMSTIPDEVLQSEFSRRAQAMRKTFAGGRPAVLRPCPNCSKEFGAADLRKHRARCPKRARARAKPKAAVAV